MDVTERYEFPYPECDPPLVKDASLIAQFQDLAQAVNDAVDDVVDAAERDLIQPPAARLAIAVLPVATTANLATPFFDVQVFSSNWGIFSALDVVEGCLRVQTPGWYLVGCHALVSSATAAVLPMVRLVVNGTAASSWSAVGGNYGVSNSRLAALSAVPLNLAENDLVQMQIQHRAPASPAWDYRPHLWAVRMVADS
ncbi:hypothetical protein AB0B30_32445 [Streptomyces narbonensis]|uniref:Minor tail protein n=1 Tax=Streptomyces narbonensis TaxID=67333 RepID=A0ABV3CIZ2_9ACTN